MEFEQLLKRIEIGMNVVGIRYKFRVNWRKFLEIGWLIFVTWSLGFYTSLGFHFVFNNLNDLERSVSMFSQSSNALSVLLRILILASHRADLKDLVEQLINLTRQGFFVIFFYLKGIS